MIYFFIFFIPYIVVLLLTPGVRRIALKLYVVDEKNHRKIHKKLITKLGGVAIYLGFLAGLIITAFLDTYFLKAHALQLGGLVVCASLILLLGIYDDFQGSGALTKFFIQIVVALLLIKGGFILERIYLPGIIDINLGSFSLPVTLLWLVGITNAINLIDGLDGLAAGMVAIISLFLCLHGIVFKESFIIYTSLAITGAAVSFLKYNFYPAKIFMGDTGSLFLGFVIASLAIYKGNPKGGDNIFFIPSLIMLLLPIMDTSFAISRRLLRRKHLFRGDFSHIHHYFIKLGLTQPSVVKGFYFITLCLGATALLIIYNYKL